jgi:transposase
VAVVHRSPRLLGLAQGRWTLAALGRVVPWLAGRAPGTIGQILRRLRVRYKRGRLYLHSPDPAYDAKLRALTGAQVLARACPDRVVLLYQDELTYYRRPTLARDWAPAGVDAPRVAAGLTPNRRRRVAAWLDATSGRLLAWQHAHFDVATLVRRSRQVRAAYPEAEVIYLAQDNWPVHRHPALAAPLAALGIAVLPLPTYAPWTNPVEALWGALTARVLHNHAFADDWPALQAAVGDWLAAWAQDPAGLLHVVGLPT